MFNLSGKYALVTGASGAIGAAIAKALVESGASVTLSGTRVDKLEALKAELGEKAHAIPCNLSDAAGASQLVKDAESAMGGLDILINNAGLIRDKLAMRMGEDDWQTVLDVNLTAAFRLSKACLRGMMKKRWGRIVNITSVVGVIGNPGQTNYAASKAGMIGMSKSLAQEVASRGITVNCLAPGYITTPMNDHFSDEQKQGFLNSIPSGRVGSAEDVAAGVIYLVSDEAAYVTGQTLHINGGMAMV